MELLNAYRVMSSYWTDPKFMSFRAFCCVVMCIFPWVWKVGVENAPKPLHCEIMRHTYFTQCGHVQVNLISGISDSSKKGKNTGNANLCSSKPTVSCRFFFRPIRWIVHSKKCADRWGELHQSQLEGLVSLVSKEIGSGTQRWMGHGIP